MSKNTNNKNKSGIFYFDFPTNVGNDLLDNQKQLIRSSSSYTTSSSSKINTKSSNTTSPYITSSNTTSSKTTSSKTTSSKQQQNSSKTNTGVYSNETGQKLKNYGG